MQLRPTPSAQPLRGTPSAQKLVPVLNLGVLAHVDAGKTSLTERLLYRAGVVDELGSVDRGTTTTDSLALERRRGITIRTAVASCSAKSTCCGSSAAPDHVTHRRARSHTSERV